jgi:hypothetical protein
MVPRASEAGCEDSLNIARLLNPHRQREERQFELPMAWRLRLFQAVTSVVGDQSATFAGTRSCDGSLEPDSHPER